MTAPLPLVIVMSAAQGWGDSPKGVGAVLPWSMKSTILPLNIWHGSVLWNFSSLRCHVFCELTFKQCFNRFLNDSVHLKLPVLRLLLASEYSSTPLIVLLCEHSLKTEYVSRCSVPSTWFCAFFIYAFKYGFSSVFCALLLNGGRNVFSWPSVCVSALPSIKCNSDLWGWQALIVSLKKVSNTW